MRFYSNLQWNITIYRIIKSSYCLFLYLYHIAYHSKRRENPHTNFHPPSPWWVGYPHSSVNHWGSFPCSTTPVSHGSGGGQQLGAISLFLSKVSSSFPSSHFLMNNLLSASIVALCWGAFCSVWLFQSRHVFCIIKFCSFLAV